MRYYRVVSRASFCLLFLVSCFDRVLARTILCAHKNLAQKLKQIKHNLNTQRHAQTPTFLWLRRPAETEMTLRTDFEKQRKGHPLQLFPAWKFHELDPKEWEWEGCVILYDINKACVCVCLVSCVWLFVTPWTVARKAPLSMGFSGQEYWIGFPLPSLRDYPDTGTKPMSPVFSCIVGRFFTCMWHETKVLLAKKRGDLSAHHSSMS